MPKVLDLTGQRYGRLKVIKYVGVKRTHKAYLCKCDCGTEKIITSSDLRSGRVKSCGCYKQELITDENEIHGLRKHRLYSIWANMKSRCYNPNATHYKRYGGRGIQICDQWRNDFKAFYDWAMNNGYKDGLTIDRINVNGDYEPSNCRWATDNEQARNTSTNKIFTINNESKSLIEWCEIYNINYRTVQDRLARGWDINRALTEPVQSKFKNKENKVV